MSEAARKGFFVWLADHHAEARELADVPPEVLGTLWADAWRQGAWHALHDSAELSGLVTRMEELIDLYRHAELDRDFSQEPASVYWRSES
jgi:hypothetical protein